MDEKALISCVAYVDLNPIRAGIALTPETSDFTSIQQRIQQAVDIPDNSQPVASLDKQIPKLLDFSRMRYDDIGLPCALTEYLELVDWSGRAIRPDKQARIQENLPPILERLNIDPVHLLRYLDHKEKGFVHAIGSRRAIQTAALKLGKAFLKGISAANRLFPEPS